MKTAKFLLLLILFSPPLLQHSIAQYSFSVRSSVFLAADRITIWWEKEDGSCEELSLTEVEHAQFNKIAKPLFKSPLANPLYGRRVLSTFSLKLTSYDEVQDEYSSFMSIPIHPDSFIEENDFSEFFRFIDDIKSARKKAALTDLPPTRPAPASPAVTSPPPVPTPAPQPDPLPSLPSPHATKPTGE